MEEQQSTYNRKWLTVLYQLGFKEYDERNDNHSMPNPCIPIFEGQRLFIEEDWCRRRIYVMIHDNENSCTGDGFFDVYIQEDFGCGAVCLPYQWSDLAAWWLHYLKMSFLGYGFKKDGKEVTLKVDLT